MCVAICFTFVELILKTQTFTMKRLFILFIALVSAVEIFAVEPEKADTTLYEQIVALDQVGVSVRMPKQHYALKQQPISSSVIGGDLIRNERILSIKEPCAPQASSEEWQEKAQSLHKATVWQQSLSEHTAGNRDDYLTSWTSLVAPW